jgi:hypothetical protein
MYDDLLFQRKTAGCTIGIKDSILPVFLDGFRVFAIGSPELTFLKKIVTLVLEVFSTVSATGCHDQRYGLFLAADKEVGGDKGKARLYYRHADIFM